MNKSSNKIRRSSVYFIAIVTVLIILSSITLFQAFKMYKEKGSTDFLALTLSASAIALSVYMILQMRMKPPKLGFEQPKVSTMIRCSNCDFETIREFKEGDYVLKEEGSCPKCNGSTFIYMIFRESEEEKKKRT